MSEWPQRASNKWILGCEDPPFYGEIPYRREEGSRYDAG